MEFFAGITIFYTEFFKNNKKELIRFYEKKVVMILAVFMLLFCGSAFAERPDYQAIREILPEGTRGIVSTINVYGGWFNAFIPNDGYKESFVSGSYNSMLQYDEKKESMIKGRLQYDERQFPIPMMKKTGRDPLEPSRKYEMATRERLANGVTVCRQRVIVLNNKTQTPMSEYYNCYYYSRTDDGVFSLQIDYLPSRDIADPWFYAFIDKIQTKEIF